MIQNSSRDFTLMKVQVYLLLLLFALALGAGFAQTAPESPLGICADPSMASSPLCSLRPITGLAPEISVPQFRLPSPRTGSPPVTVLPSSPTNSDRVESAAAETPGPQAPPPKRSDFHAYATQVLGGEIEIFGQQLFVRTPSTFAPVDRVPVPSTYVLGPGDEIQLRCWGQVNFDMALVIDREGMINVPQAGPVRVAGLKLQDLQPFLRGHMSRVFRNFELAVNLGQLRSIQIYVVGAARRPGMYTVSSLATLVNAVFASGGPSEVGSFRKIELRRQGQVIAVLDLYNLLIRGDKTADRALEPGDIVFFPTIGPQVALGGSVHNAAIYELSGETTLSELLELAGGASPVADLSRIVLERITENGDRVVQWVSLRETNSRLVLRSGDVIRLQPIMPQTKEAVTLRGHVSAPGRYPWFRGMRLRDLIRGKDDILSREYWRVRNQAAVSSASDTAASVTQNAPARPRAVGRGFDYPEVNWSYATIERKDPETLAYRIIPFHPGKLLLDQDENENLTLEPDDIVTVYTQDDFRNSIGEQKRVVTIEGEVRMAGAYTISAGESFGELIKRAGGLTAAAYPAALEFYRRSIEQQQNERLRELTEELEMEVAQQSQQRRLAASGEQSLQEAEFLLAQQRRIVNNLRRVRAKGRLVIPLASTGADMMSYAQLPLEDGDRVYIPPRPSVVNVFGEVVNPGSHVHRDGLTVRALLKQVGGVSRIGDSKRMFIIRCDGTVTDARSQGRRRFLNITVNPGDSVVVPPRWPRDPFLRGLRDWSQVFAQLALGAAAINVLN